MRDGLKVFDADAHVVYPADLWSRFLDKRFVDRVGPQGPVRLRPLQPGHRRRPLDPAPTSIYGQFQKAINWTTEDMIAKYGEDMVMKGFTGDRVAHALEVEGVDAMVIYGPEYDMWLEGIDPELQAAMARAYNRWGQEMRETSGGKVITSGPDPAQRRRRVRSRRSSTRTTSSASAASGPARTTSTAATSATATTTRSTSSSRTSTARSRPTSSWASTGRPRAPTASTRSPSGTRSCTATRRRTRCCR